MTANSKKNVEIGTLFEKPFTTRDYQLSHILQS